MAMTRAQREAAERLRGNNEYLEEKYSGKGAAKKPVYKTGNDEMSVRPKSYKTASQARHEAKKAREQSYVYNAARNARDIVNNVDPYAWQNRGNKPADFKPIWSLTGIFDALDAIKKDKERKADSASLGARQASSLMKQQGGEIATIDRDIAALSPGLKKESATKESALKTMLAEDDPVVIRGKQAVDAMANGIVTDQIKADAEAYRKLQEQHTSSPVGNQRAALNADKKFYSDAYDAAGYQYAAQGAADYKENVARGAQVTSEVNRVLNGKYTPADTLRDEALGGRDTAAYITMTRDEIDTYRYWLAKNKEVADRYIKHLKPQLIERASDIVDQNIEDIENEGFKKVVRGFMTAAGSGKNVGRAIRNIPAAIVGSEDVEGAGIVERGQQKMAQRLEGVEKGVNDFIYNMIPMIPTAAVSMVPGAGAALSAGYTAARSYGGTYADTIQQGYAPGEAQRYALVNAASEAGMQYLLGGIAKTGGSKSLSSTLQRAAQKAANNPAAAKGLAILGNMGSEAAEEYLQANLDPVLRNTILDENNELNPVSRDKWEAAVMGALMSLVMNAPSEISEGVRTAQSGRAYNSPDVMQALVERGLASGADTAANRQAQRIAGKLDAGKAISNFEVGSLAQANEAAIAAEARANAILDKTGVQRAYDPNETVKLKDGREVVIVARDGSEYTAIVPGENGYTRITIDEILHREGVRRAVDAFLHPEDKADITGKYDHRHVEKTADQTFLDDLQKRYGIKAAIEDMQPGAEAFYDRSTNTIHFAPDSTRADVIGGVTAHELAHAAEASEHYKAYSDYAVQRLFGNDTDALRQAVEAKQEQYIQHGVYLSDADAVSEIVADYTRNLYKSPADIETLVTGSRGMAQSIYDSIRTAIQKIRAFFKGDEAALRNIREYQDLRRAQKLFARALSAMPEVQAEAAPAYALNPNFEAEYDAWDGTSRGGYFKIGNTSEVLKSIGVKDQNIYWDKSKIADIKKKHTDMTDDVIKAVPQLLEDPVIVMQSNTVANRIVMLGEVYDAAGNPVLVALELKPTGKNAGIQDFTKIASAYGKRNIQGMLDTSDILYLDPNKNRTNRWLEARLGLQLPAWLTNYGSIGTVTYVNKDVNGRISFDEERGKTAMELAMEEAKNRKYSIKEESPQIGDADIQAGEREYIPKPMDDAAPAERSAGSTGREQSYFNRTVNRAADEIARLMGVVPGQKRAARDAVRELATRYYRTGAVEAEEMARVFQDLWRSGRDIDSTMREAYADLKQELRSTQIDVSAARTDVPEFEDWRRRANGKLRFSGKDGVPVDVFYEEVAGRYPGLLDAEIMSPAQQADSLLELYDSIADRQMTLDESRGEAGMLAAAKEFKRIWNEVEQGIERVRENETERQNVRKTGTVTQQAAREAYERIAQLRRRRDQIDRNNLLTRHEKAIAEEIADGKITADELKIPPSQAVRDYAEILRGIRQDERTTAEYKKQARTGRYDRMEELTQNSGLWKDKKRGLWYARETQERNIEDIAKKDPEGARAIEETVFEPIHRNEANGIRMMEDYRTRIRNLELTPAESVLVQAYGEGKVTDAELSHYAENAPRKRITITDENGDIVYDADLKGKKARVDADKVKRGVQEFREIYKGLLEKANDALVRNGYPPIAERADYFPHFSTRKGMAATVQEMFGFDPNNPDAIPEDIAGLTHIFRPGKKWFSHAQQRNTDATDFDALTGFDRYLNGIKDVIWHTDDIQNVRALESVLRGKHTDEKMRERIREIYATAESDAQAQAAVDALVNEPRLPNYVSNLRSYGDMLAGKKSFADRNMEQQLGRNAYMVMRALEGRVASNMIGNNVGSWLTNFIPLVQSAGQVKTVNMLKGIKDTIKNWAKNDGFVQNSDFLVNRRGTENLVRGGLQKFSAAGVKPMEWIDNFVTESIVRGKYAEEIKAGASPEEAMQRANRTAADIVADRSYGALPTIFHAKNPLSKLLTTFQVEVNNQYSNLLKDMPRSVKGSGGKAALTIAWRLLKYCVGAWLYNELYEKLVGRRPAFDPIGLVQSAAKDYAAGDAAKATTNLFSDVAEQIPFIGGLVGGGRVPVSSAIPFGGSLTDIAKNIGDVATGSESAKDKLGKELLKPIWYIAPPGGGGAAKKAVEGAQAIARGGEYGVDKDGNRKLKFATDGDGIDMLRALVFGKYATEGGQEYVNGGFKGLSASQTEAHTHLVENGVRPERAEKMMREISQISGDVDTAGETITGSEKRNRMEAIEDYGLTPEQRHGLYYDLFFGDELKAKMDEAVKQGIGKDTLADIYRVQAESESEQGAAGKTIDNAADFKLKDEIDGRRLTERQRECLYDVFGVSSGVASGKVTQEDINHQIARQEALADAVPKETYTAFDEMEWDSENEAAEKREWILENCKSEDEIAAMYAYYMESKDADERSTIAYAKEQGVRPSAFVEREIQKAGEHGMPGEPEEDAIWEDGKIVVDEHGTTESGTKKAQVCDNLMNSGYTEEEKEVFYQKQYSTDDNFPYYAAAGLPVDDYLSVKGYTATLKADKDENGKSISGSKKQKFMDFLEGSDMSEEQKLFFFAQEYKVSGAEAQAVREYINGLDTTDDVKEKLLASVELGGSSGGSGRRGRSGRRSSGKSAAVSQEIPDAVWNELRANVKTPTIKSSNPVWETLEALLDRGDKIREETMQQELAAVDATPYMSSAWRAERKREIRKRYGRGMAS